MKHRLGVRAFGGMWMLAAASTACGGERGYGTGDREAIADNLGLEAGVLSFDGTPDATLAGSEQCPSYEESFIPLVFDPVCSKCHGTTPGLEDYGVYSVASARCGTIGERVGAGEMPPPSAGFSFTASQRAVVEQWVGLGCPQTAAEASALCPDSGDTASGGPPDGGAPPPPGPADAVVVSKAEWDADKQELRIEGEVSDSSTSVVIRFAGREEAVPVEGGRFRAELGNVTDNPGTVVVESGNGGRVTATVLAD